MQRATYTRSTHHIARTMCRYTYRSVGPSADQAAAERIQCEAGTENERSALRYEASDEAPDEDTLVDDEWTKMNDMTYAFNEMRLKEAAAIKEAEEDAAKKQAMQTLVAKRLLLNANSLKARMRTQPQ
jgi:hypothetical protein